jgi:hypothetical protein
MSDIPSTARARWRIPLFAAGVLFWTALSGAVGYLIKSVADQEATFQEKADELRDEHQLAFEAERLKDFWWPVYFRLKLDTDVWGAILSTKADPELAKLRPELVDKFLLPNHDEVVKVIEGKFYLGASSMDEHLRSLFIEYIDHVAVFHAIRNAANSDPTLSGKVPATFKRPFPGYPDSSHPCSKDQPDCFITEIEKTVYRLQEEYDENMRTFFQHGHLPKPK